MPPELKDYEESSLQIERRHELPLPPLRVPALGYEATAALFRQWEEEAARMTPEEIAAEDAAYADFNPPRLSLPIPDLSDHD